MPSFLNKVFGRKKDGSGGGLVSPGSGDLLDGKFEDVSPSESPSATEFPELKANGSHRGRGAERTPTDSKLRTFFRSRSRPASPVRPNRKIDELPALPLSLFTDISQNEALLTEKALGERTLTPVEAVGLVRACSRAINDHGLETLGIMNPHWYSASPEVQRRLISLFLHSLTTKSPYSSFDSEVNSTKSPHDVAAVLRWALRHLQLQGDLKEDWYQTFFDEERKAEYPPKAFSDTLSPLIPSEHLELLKAVLEIFSQLAAHAETNSTSGSKLSKIYGLWLLNTHRVETKDDWRSFYARWEIAGRQLEHIFFARIRDEAVNNRMPTRLVDLVRKYPYGVVSPTDDQRLLPRPMFTTRVHDALLVRVETELLSEAARPKTRIHPLRLIAEALSNTSVEGDLSSLWTKVVEASKAEGTGTPLSKIFSDDTIRFLSLVPAGEGSNDSTSPAFSLLPLSPSSPSAKRLSFSLSEFTDEIKRTSSMQSKAPTSASPLSPISADWSLFSASGFGASPTLTPLSSTLFASDIERTAPPSRKSSRHGKEASSASSSAPRKSVEFVSAPRKASIPEETPEPTTVSRVALLQVVPLDEAFIDFWHDALLDPISAAWPAFVVCKIKAGLVPELKYAKEGGEGTVKWVVLEQTYSVKAPPPPPVPATEVSSAEPQTERPSSPHSLGKKRFSFWTSSRSNSTTSVGSSRNRKERERGQRVNEMGEVISEEGSDGARPSAARSGSNTSTIASAGGRTWRKRGGVGEVVRVRIPSPKPRKSVDVKSVTSLDAAAATTAGAKKEEEGSATAAATTVVAAVPVAAAVAAVVGATNGEVNGTPMKEGAVVAVEEKGAEPTEGEVKATVEDETVVETLEKAEEAPIVAEEKVQETLVAPLSVPEVVEVQPEEPAVAVKEAEPDVVKQEEAVPVESVPPVSEEVAAVIEPEVVPVRAAVDVEALRQEEQEVEVAEPAEDIVEASVRVVAEEVAAAAPVEEVQDESVAPDEDGSIGKPESDVVEEPTAVTEAEGDAEPVVAPEPIQEEEPSAPVEAEAAVEGVAAPEPVEEPTAAAEAEGAAELVVAPEPVQEEEATPVEVEAEEIVAPEPEDEEPTAVAEAEGAAELAVAPEAVQEEEPAAPIEVEAEEVVAVPEPVEEETTAAVEAEGAADLLTAPEAVVEEEPTPTAAAEVPADLNAVHESVDAEPTAAAIEAEDADEPSVPPGLVEEEPPAAVEAEGAAELIAAPEPAEPEAQETAAVDVDVPPAPVGNEVHDVVAPIEEAVASADLAAEAPVSLGTPDVVEDEVEEAKPEGAQATDGIATESHINDKPDDSDINVEGTLAGSVVADTQTTVTEAEDVQGNDEPMEELPQESDAEAAAPAAPEPIIEEKEPSTSLPVEVTKAETPAERRLSGDEIPAEAAHQPTDRAVEESLIVEEEALVEDVAVREEDIPQAENAAEPGVEPVVETPQTTKDQEVVVEGQEEEFAHAEPLDESPAQEPEPSVVLEDVVSEPEPVVEASAEEKEGDDDGAAPDLASAEEAVERDVEVAPADVQLVEGEANVEDVQPEVKGEEHVEREVKEEETLESEVEEEEVVKSEDIVKPEAKEEEVVVETKVEEAEPVVPEVKEEEASAPEVAVSEVQEDLKVDDEVVVEEEVKEEEVVEPEIAEPVVAEEKAVQPEVVQPEPEPEPDAATEEAVREDPVEEAKDLEVEEQTVAPAAEEIVADLEVEPFAAEEQPPVVDEVKEKDVEETQEKTEAPVEEQVADTTVVEDSASEPATTAEPVVDAATGETHDAQIQEESVEMEKSEIVEEEVAEVEPVAPVVEEAVLEEPPVEDAVAGPEVEAQQVEQVEEEHAPAVEEPKEEHAEEASAVVLEEAVEEPAVVEEPTVEEEEAAPAVEEPKEEPVEEAGEAVPEEVVEEVLALEEPAFATADSANDAPIETPDEPEAPVDSGEVDQSADVMDGEAEPVAAVVEEATVEPEAEQQAVEAHAEEPTPGIEEPKVEEAVDAAVVAVEKPTPTFDEPVTEVAVDTAPQLEAPADVVEAETLEDAETAEAETPVGDADVESKPIVPAVEDAIAEPTVEAQQVEQVAEDQSVGGDELKEEVIADVSHEDSVADATADAEAAAEAPIEAPVESVEEKGEDVLDDSPVEAVEEEVVEEKSVEGTADEKVEDVVEEREEEAVEDQAADVLEESAEKTVEGPIDEVAKAEIEAVEPDVIIEDHLNEEPPVDEEEATSTQLEVPTAAEAGVLAPEAEAPKEIVDAAESAEPEINVGGGGLNEVSLQLAPMAEDSVASAIVEDDEPIATSEAAVDEAEAEAPVDAAIAPEDAVKVTSASFEDAPAEPVSSGGEAAAATEEPTPLVKDAEEEKAPDLAVVQPVEECIEATVPSEEPVPEAERDVAERSVPIVNVVSNVPHAEPLKTGDEDEADARVDLPPVPLVDADFVPPVPLDTLEHVITTPPAEQEQPESPEAPEAPHFSESIEHTIEAGSTPSAEALLDSVQVAPVADEKEPTKEAPLALDMTLAESLAEANDLPTAIETAFETGLAPSAEALLDAVQATLTATVFAPSEPKAAEQAKDASQTSVETGEPVANQNGNGHRHDEELDKAKSKETEAVVEEAPQVAEPQVEPPASDSNDPAPTVETSEVEQTADAVVVPKVEEAAAAEGSTVIVEDEPGAPAAVVEDEPSVPSSDEPIAPAVEELPEPTPENVESTPVVEGGKTICAPVEAPVVEEEDAPAPQAVDEPAAIVDDTKSVLVEDGIVEEKSETAAAETVDERSPVPVEDKPILVEDDDVEEKGGAVGAVPHVVDEPVAIPADDRPILIEED
ncbi:hypothetical protein D9611_000532 [Ephemerocybe angulata]|uniref:Rho-GAP domain-containing protein n=1 Tax=Ephemerocybe angulata TaxID=980116 RepID=A0A8H5BNW8_9AGAR|nr:hypothetical protein D9611_000532 [Tulosesus angulatus]